MERSLCRNIEISDGTNTITIFDNVFDFLESLYFGSLLLSLGNTEQHTFDGVEQAFRILMSTLPGGNLEVSAEIMPSKDLEVLSCCLGDVFVAVHVSMYQIYGLSGMEQSKLPDFFSIDGHGLLEETFRSIKRIEG